MQGKKNYQEELFIGFQLSDYVPKDNFYRRLNQILDLQFLYKLTAPYYGSCGQKSIDPVVFFKLCLIGYLENINTDRSLMEHCKMRMDILLFLGYNINEPFPWHSTLSRTRAMLPEPLFVAVFEKILKQCIESGLVSGHTQVIDSAPVKANASMDSLELKVPKEELEEHLAKVRYQSTQDREKNKKDDTDHTPRRKSKENKASDKQKTITASDKELKEIESRNRNWSKNQDERPGAKTITSRYTSNKTHYSPTDPDARISVKPGKARKLNYLSQLAVDPAKHVITHIGADFADKHDSRCLNKIVESLQPRLKEMGLLWTNLLADTGYSSGENYAMLQEKGLQAFIPPHGTYKGGPEGFIYNEEENYWLCRNNKKASYKGVRMDKDGANKKKRYLTKRSDCKGCIFKSECIGKAYEKRIDITFYKDYYEQTKERITTYNGMKMKRLRQSVVEPVFGILTQFMAMRKVNTKGIQNANKQMLLAATAYNLKKILKHAQRPPKSMAQSIGLLCDQLNDLLSLILSSFKALKFKVKMQSIILKVT